MIVAQAGDLGQFAAFGSFLLLFLGGAGAYKIHYGVGQIQMVQLSHPVLEMKQNQTFLWPNSLWMADLCNCGAGSRAEWISVGRDSKKLFFMYHLNTSVMITGHCVWFNLVAVGAVMSSAGGSDGIAVWNIPGRYGTTLFTFNVRRLSSVSNSRHQFNAKCGRF